MDATSMLVGIFVGGMLCGMIGFLLGIVVGVQSGRADALKKWWKAAIGDQISTLQTGQTFEIGFYVCKDVDDDDGGDTEALPNSDFGGSSRFSNN